MYDIAIIGLGPAGATMARLLDKKYKTIVIDRKNSGVTKCCGGLLSPDAQKILARFDICLPKDVLVDPQIFSVKTIDLDNRIEKYYQRFYINMNRAKFDNFLVSLIPDTVEMRKDSVCTKIERENGMFSLTVKTREAAGMISPSSLEGISYSMESGKILAEIVNMDLNSNRLKTAKNVNFVKKFTFFGRLVRQPTGLSNKSNIGHDYFMKTLGIRIRLLCKIIKMPFMYNRILRKLIMTSGIRAIKKHA